MQQKYGEEAWDNVRRLANIDSPTFSIHQVWPMVTRARKRSIQRFVIKHREGPY